MAGRVPADRTTRRLSESRAGKLHAHIGARQFWESELRTGISVIAVALLIGIAMLLPDYGTASLSLAWAAAALLGVTCLRLALRLRSSGRHSMSTVHSLQALGQGNLVESFGTGGSSLDAHITDVATRLSAMVAEVRSNVAVSLEMTGRLEQNHESLAGRTERQSAALQRTASAVTQATDAVAQNASSSAAAKSATTDAARAAQDGSDAAQMSVRAMQRIRTASTEVSAVVSTINDIALRTKLLALNATVEAARAGRVGRGFAVVANDISALAQQCEESAKAIQRLVGNARHEVEAGERAIDSVLQRLQALTKLTHDVSIRVESIADASAEQASAMRAVSADVQELNQITSDNTEMVVEANASAVRLHERIGQIMSALSHFRLAQGTANEALALVERAASMAKREGPSAALAAINDPTQGFRDRDMYVFVIDREGRHHAQAAAPERVGSYVRDFKGVDGEALMRDITKVIDAGGGWIDYELNNPQTGRVDPKTSYFKVFSDGLIIGCGVYRTFRALHSRS